MVQKVDLGKYTPTVLLLIMYKRVCFLCSGLHITQEYKIVFFFFYFSTVAQDSSLKGMFTF